MISREFTQFPVTRTTNGMAAILFYLAKEDDQNSFVREQHGSYDVKCIRPILLRFKESVGLH